MMTHLNAALKLLCEGVDPPTGRINPQYKQQQSNPRRCIECDAWHDTIVECQVTGFRIEEIPKCPKCINWGSYKEIEGEIDLH